MTLLTQTKDAINKDDVFEEYSISTCRCTHRDIVTLDYFGKPTVSHLCLSIDHPSRADEHNLPFYQVVIESSL